MAWVRNRKKRERDETIPVMFREKLVRQIFSGGKEAGEMQWQNLACTAGRQENSSIAGPP